MSSSMNDDDTYYCSKCNKQIAIISRTMHDIRCTVNIQQQQPQQQQIPIPVAAARHHVFTTSGGGTTTPIVHAQELKSVKTLESYDNDYIACPTCTYHNQLDSVTCECCDTALIDSMNSSTNSLDNHVDNSDTNEMNDTWSCPTCTYNNSIDMNTCEMCNHGTRPADMRRPDDIINDRLIHDDQDDDELCIRSSTSESSGIHPLTASALGALGGIMLARLQNRPMSTGALQGAAYGAMGGMLFNELNSRVDDDMRSPLNSDNLYNNRHDHFFTSFRENNRSLFEAFFQGLDENDTATSDERLQAINSLPTHTFHDDNNGTATCNICLEAFVNGDGVKTLPCLHMFHTSCIDTWLSRKSECPLCKYSLC